MYGLGNDLVMTYIRLAASVCMVVHFIFVLSYISDYAFCFDFVVLFMIDNVVQFGNILYMSLRVLVNYIFDRHVRRCIAIVKSNTMLIVWLGRCMVITLAGVAGVWFIRTGLVNFCRHRVVSHK